MVEHNDDLQDAIWPEMWDRIGVQEDEKGGGCMNGKLIEIYEHTVLIQDAKKIDGSFRIGRLFK